MTADTEQKVLFDNLVPGVRYRIVLQDCCVEGHFDGTFLRHDDFSEADENGPARPHEAVFDIGVIGPHWGQLTFTVLNDEAAVTRSCPVCNGDGEVPGYEYNEVCRKCIGTGELP